MKKKVLIKTTRAAHAEVFGLQPSTTAWAPGRIEVLGNHTDYNEGTVFSTAIDLGIVFTLSKSDQPGIRLQAIDIGNQVATFDAADMEKVKGADWANYVKGVFHYIQEHLKQSIDGIDCSFSGSIPMGAGLSSSAALEVAAAFSVLDYLDEKLELKQVAQFCQKAEQVFAGTNCGLLDQFSSIFGQEHSLIHCDFRSLDVTASALADDIEFLVVNPHVKHSLSDSPYNERRKHCEQAAAQLGELIDHPVSALRDVSWEEFEAQRDKIDPEAAQRAAHIVGEITRVEAGMDLLANNDLEAFGELLFDSHQSSIDNFENSCPELDIVVTAAREAGAVGARLSGGGFGGSAIVMVHSKDAQTIGAKISILCQAQGISPAIVEVVPSAGAMVIKT